MYRMIYLGFVLFLVGCGDNYPKTGKVVDYTSHIIDRTKEGRVYELDKESLNTWKSSYNTLVSTHEKDLTYIETFLNRGIELGVAYPFKEHLFEGDIDFNQYVDATLKKIKLETEKIKEQSKKRMDENLILISSMMERKELALKAKNDVSEIESGINQKIEKLESAYRKSVRNNMEVLQKLSPKKLGLKESPSELIASGKYYGYKEVKADTSSCKAVVKKSIPFYLRSNIDFYTISKPTKIENKTYCLYVKYISSRRSKHMKLFVASLTKADKKQLLESVEKRVAMYEGRKRLKVKISNIVRDHDDIRERLAVFGHKDQVTYDRLLRENVKYQHDLENEYSESKSRQEIIRLISIKIRKVFKRNMKVIIEKMLYADLEQVSEIQPDGQFNMTESSSHLIVINSANNKTFFGVIRRENFKNQPLIEFKLSELLTIADMVKISI